MAAAALVAALEQQGYTVERRAFLPDQEDRRRVVLVAQDAAVERLVAVVAPRTAPPAVGTALAVALYPTADPDVPAPVTLQLKAVSTFVSLTAGTVVEMLDALEALLGRLSQVVQDAAGTPRERRVVYVDGRWFTE